MNAREGRTDAAPRRAGAGRPEGGAAFGLDLDKFVRERRGRWSRFEALLDEVERAADHEMGQARLLELVRLYRQIGSDLNEARSYTASPEILGRLNHLANRGYRVVYRRSHGRRFADEARRFVLVEAPAAFRRERASVMAAALALALGAVLGAVAVVVDRAHGERLIPGEFFTESPAKRVERIEQAEERISSLEEASAFSAFLFSHNIQVSFLAFSLGALTLVGGVVILFYNGVILGAVAAMYLLDGAHVFFLAWVGPHGALEIPAIVFGGAAGLRLGRALLRPGEQTTGAALREAFPSVWRILLVACLVLVAAGLIEGSFSQFSAKTIPYGLKISVAVVLFAALFSYLFLRRLPEEA